MATLNARNTTLKGIWAADATTVIPSPPVPNTPYRDPNVTAATMTRGQGFYEIADSSLWNELEYEITTLSKDTEVYGIMRWSPLTEYIGDASLAIGTNGSIYRAILNSGPTNSGPQDPTSTTGYWESLADYIKRLITASGGMFVPGDIDLKPFRSSALPVGWYFCNGGRYANTTPQAQVLASLPASYKSDWSITTTSAGTNVPNFFNGTNGYFFRAVDGSTRQPGSIQTDAMRQVSASTSTSGGGNVTATGTFYGATGSGSATGVFSNVGGGTLGDIYDVNRIFEFGQIRMNINAAVPSPTVTVNIIQSGTVATENRPMNIGMTPAIFLGV